MEKPKDCDYLMFDGEKVIKSMIKDGNFNLIQKLFYSLTKLSRLTDTECLKKET